MIRVEHRAALPHPPADVFRLLTDFAGYPAWQPDVTRAQLEGPRAARGATVRQNRRFMNTRVETVLEITEFEPDAVLALRTVSGGGKLRLYQSYRVAADAEGSHLELVHELDGLSRVSEQYFRPALAPHARRLFERLAALLAGSDATPGPGRTRPAGWAT
jgi:hypothetical protein